MPDILTQPTLDNLLTPEDRRRLDEARRQGATLDEAVFQVLPRPGSEVMGALAQSFGVPFVELDGVVVEPALLKRFPARLLLERQLLPIDRDDDGAVTVATGRLVDSSGLDELQMVSGIDCRPALARPEDIARLLKSSLGVGADTVQTLVDETGESIQVLTGDADGGGVDLSEAAEDASIIRFVNEVLIEAIELRATDVHFEPFEDRLRVRYRIDGVLQTARIPAEVRQFQAAIISRLKILSNLDIAEKRLPQDGRIKLRIAARDIDVRVSVIPMLHGEAVVLRLLDRSAAMLGLASIGMSEGDVTSFKRILGLPHGIILVTGPTGSGKTTTLYAALGQINDDARKIITIEDPVEYQMQGINQIQVSTKAGLTFARGLRSILRHDPDVLLIGEIRDMETAEIAVQASLTGHLVFSTLHTNDAPGALTRLVDMGIEPYLVASSLEAVLAQRLVRLVCNECRQELPQSEVDKARRAYGLDELTALYAGAGCRACQGTGYRGRTGVFEFMDVTEQIGSMVLDGQSSGAIRRAAHQQGMTSLRQDGWRLVLQGRTTIEEVLRVTKDERMEGRAPVSARDIENGNHTQASDT